jgi:3-phosphoshikimate 1-carboxyvinyltransferase
MTDSLLILPASGPVCGEVVVPGSKSITNRALIMAALADAESTLNGALFSDDTGYMAESLRRLGISVEEDEPAQRLHVKGTGGRIPAAEAELFVGNAGTAARFLTALCALGNGTYHIDGVARMRQRPIADLLDGLNQLGVDARSDLGNGCPPLTVVSEGLRGGRLEMKADVSSQYLTAILLAAPGSAGGVEIEIRGELASRPYIEMTIRMMDQWGVTADIDQSFRRFRIPGGEPYRAQAYRVEPDASSASYFFAAAAVTGGKVRIPGIGKWSLQGDARFVDVLAEMGCVVEKGPDFIEVEGAETLRGVDVDMNGISDTVMTLATIAPFAETPTTIRNVEHIRYKETDRLSAVTAELKRLGVKVEERRDGLTIYPAESLNPAEIETYDDHRMAMSFAVTGLRSPGVAIKDPGCVSKTFPDFFQRLDRLVHGRA